MANKLEIGGMTPQAVYGKLVEKGLSASDAAIVVGSWIFENFGKVKRVFNYAEGFPDAVADCSSKFARSFAHTDWVDGEDVVQAEKTAGEEGFNQRFHRIEDDLDALGVDVAKVFLCLADMRRSLRGLLDEIRTEINRIHSDLYDCCNKGVVVGPFVEHLPAYGAMVEGAIFMGTTTFAGRNVGMWRTERGIMMLPAISTMDIDITTDVRVSTPGKLARYMEENKTVRDAFGGQPVTKKDLVSRFGAERAADGRTIRELVDILPDEASFNSLDDLVEGVAEREAAALRTTGGSDAAVAAVFGLEAEVAKVSEAPVENVSAIPTRVRRALSTAGIKTMGRLAESRTEEVIRLLKNEGVEASAGEVAEWRAVARTLGRIR
jgi:hypothetical protein